MTTVLVAGAIANRHRFGGSVWVRLSWAEAFARLGFDVLFLEQLHPGGDPATFESTMRAFGLEGVLLREGEPAAASVRDRLDDADVLVNLSGHLRDGDLLRRPRCRIFVDLDPGYTQIWHEQGLDVGLGGHDFYFTVGWNVGTPGCGIPTLGLDWRPIRQPVVLDRWPVAGGDFSTFSTVASWRGAFGPVQWNGSSHGPKAHQFRRFAEVPRAVGVPFEVALDIDAEDADDRERLEHGGWRIRDPRTVTTPAAFARFVARSGAEFSPAQDVYVSTRSGWFSDRTVRYLASGKPALVQDTGFSRGVPVGEGLLSFRTERQAVERARELVENYATHRVAARRLAEELFASDRAVAPILEATGLAA